MSFEIGTLVAATVFSALALLLFTLDGNPGFLLGAAAFWFVYIKGVD